MHQTTVRFGRELWLELSRAAEEDGVSTAAYVREAAIRQLVQGRVGLDEAGEPDVPETARTSKAVAAAAAAREDAAALSGQASQPVGQARVRRTGYATQRAARAADRSMRAVRRA
jgi:hypothetical protein